MWILVGNEEKSEQNDNLSRTEDWVKKDSERLGGNPALRSVICLMHFLRTNGNEVLD